ncbi:MAG TPA: gamma-glutamyltransferase, partial [Bacteroidota bacterium]|nr:gamma-glutamyltransferase [Bacteroidota bacterium]
MKHNNLFVVAFAIAAFVCFASGASRAPVKAKHAMVVSADKQASEIGVRIIQQGGNAVDAAVAVGFALAVVYPQAGNLGGGGFMLVRLHTNETAVVDFRETASRHASSTMYLDAAGNVTDSSVDGGMASGVPGTVAGLLAALDKYGKLKLHDVIRPAIDLAESGFIVDDRLARTLREYSDSLSRYSSTRKVYFRNGALLGEGDTLRLPELAAVLRRIDRNGVKGFYEGETARLIVDEMRRDGGIIDAQDLAAYTPVFRQSIYGKYRGYDV